MPALPPVPQFAIRLPLQTASWYHLPGQQTASGVEYGGNGVAHRWLPFGMTRTLCREDHPLICAQVVVVDRFGKDDPKDVDWDVPKEVARKLFMLKKGIVLVAVNPRGK